MRQTLSEYEMKADSTAYDLKNLAQKYGFKRQSLSWPCRGFRYNF